jgi:ATP-binding cassette subfamily F protein uup
MNLLLAESLTRALGEKLLFENLTFGIDQGQKLALVARNGTGKTTLLNILAGKDEPDEGNVVYRSGIGVQYLSQNPVFPNGSTAIEVLFDTQNPVAIAVKEYEKLMADANAHQTTPDAKKLEEVTHAMDMLNAWDFEAKAKEIMGKLGLTDLNQSIETMSGGQRKKLALAQVLIHDSDLLILDEPTNHLDITMIEWLEGYLSRSKLSLLLVSHDRYFIDAVCNEIVELDGLRLFRYKGNYANFLETKHERQLAEKAELDKARNTYTRELEWMRRMPQARGTKQKARIDSFYQLEEKVSGKVEQTPQAFAVAAQRMGNKILELNYVSKSFGELRIMRDFHYIFRRGEKIGIIGKNGTGKSTFMNLIMGKIRPDQGSIVKGETIVFGHFEQDGLIPDTDKRVLEIVKSVAEEIKTKTGSMGAAQFLYYFGFSYADQHSYFSRLSGGEKRKLYLLLTLLKNPNFLILDEPTNDLDIFTLNQLEEFLVEFPGCLLVVSHDRYFMDRVTDHMLVFEGDGVIKDFPGNYSDYLIWKQANQPKKETNEASKPAKEKKNQSSNKASYKQKVEYTQLETEIAQHEDEKQELETLMNTGNGTHEQLGSWAKRYQELVNMIDTKTERWMELDELM